jgi:hypothetical protein
LLSAHHRVFDVCKRLELLGPQLAVDILVAEDVVLGSLKVVKHDICFRQRSPAISCIGPGPHPSLPERNC